jgi:hypothetical protein
VISDDVEVVATKRTNKNFKMAKLARYHNGQTVVELPILGSKRDGTLQLGHAEGAPRGEGADELKVGLCPVQAEGELKTGCCQPITDLADAPADDSKPDGQAAGSDAPADAPKGKKNK